MCLRLSAHKQPPDGVIHSPGCVSEISKKEERTDLGQKVSDKSVKWTPTKTAHTACLYFYRKAKELKPASLTVTSRGTRVTQSVLGTLCSLMIVVHYVLKKLCHPGSSKASNDTKRTIFTEALKGEKRRHVVPACKKIKRKP